jgi:hypothetical protein
MERDLIELRAAAGAQAGWAAATAGDAMQDMFVQVREEGQADGFGVCADAALSVTSACSTP